MRGPILIVDDHEDARATLRMALEAESYSVREARDGNEALRMLVGEEALRPALIILDLVMPAMSGWEFLMVLRSYVRLRSIPVVVISALAPAAPTLERGLIASFFRKPAPLERLLPLVEKHVGGAECWPPLDE